MTAIALSGIFFTLMFTYIITKLLVDIIQVYIIIYDINETFMGITLLGIGNALPDALTTIALAKRGYA